MVLTEQSVETSRHRTAWVEAGPTDGPPMIFLHGWPELGIVWRAQVEHFAAAGWRCVAPDMRGYGGSSAPDTIAAYTARELVTDMVELHDALGGEPAIWVGRDSGSRVAWGMASHHADRRHGVVSLCVPYQARGIALPTLVPLVDRDLYPVERYPVGQWDYWLFYRERFNEAARQFEANVAETIAALYGRSSPAAVGKPAMTATVREKGGWFSPTGPSPSLRRDESMLAAEDFDRLVAAFQRNGFSGPNASYMNDEANLAFAAEAPAFGRLTLPALFIHAAWDTVCETIRSRLAEPMRADCDDLSEVTIDGGHELMLERPDEVNVAIEQWIRERCPMS